MTTVMCTRDYLITDCRMTTSARYNKVYIDNRCKIETKCTAVYEGKRIVAMAGCGDVDLSSHAKSVLMSSISSGVELSIISNILHKTPADPTKDLCYNLIFLTEDGQCVDMSVTTFNLRSENTLAHLDCRLFDKPLKDSTSWLLFGSGRRIFSILEDRIDTSELNFVDIFYFAAGLDPASSNSYSVYSRVTNELFTTVNPTKQDITERINRVLKKIDFTDPKYKNKNKVNL